MRTCVGTAAIHEGSADEGSAKSTSTAATVRLSGWSKLARDAVRVARAHKCTCARSAWRPNFEIVACASQSLCKPLAARSASSRGCGSPPSERFGSTYRKSLSESSACGAAASTARGSSSIGFEVSTATTAPTSFRAFLCGPPSSAPTPAAPAVALDEDDDDADDEREAASRFLLALFAPEAHAPFRTASKHSFRSSTTGSASPAGAGAAPMSFCTSLVTCLRHLSLKPETRMPPSSLSMKHMASAVRRHSRVLPAPTRHMACVSWAMCVLENGFFSGPFERAHCSKDVKIASARASTSACLRKPCPGGIMPELLSVREELLADDDVPRFRGSAIAAFSFGMEIPKSI